MRQGDCGCFCLAMIITESQIQHLCQGKIRIILDWVNVVMIQILMLWSWTEKFHFWRLVNSYWKKKSHNSKAWSLLQINHLKDLNKFCSSVDQVYVCSDSTGTTTNRSAKTQIFSQHVRQQMSQGGRFNCRSEFRANMRSMWLSV